MTQGASPAAPGAAGGAGGPVAVDGPAVTLSLAPGKAGGAKAGPGGVKDSMPSVAEAIVASERIKPGDATAAPSDLPAVGLAAACLAQAAQEPLVENALEPAGQ